MQKAQARVHVSPMIMKIAAWRFPGLGEYRASTASSHTVASLNSRTSLSVSANTGEPGARTRIHGGLRATGSWAVRLFGMTHGNAPRALFDHINEPGHVAYLGLACATVKRSRGESF